MNFHARTCGSDSFLHVQKLTPANAITSCAHVPDEHFFIILFGTLCNFCRYPCRYRQDPTAILRVNGGDMRTFSNDTEILIAGAGPTDAARN
jgi:hypothetical protein